MSVKNVISWHSAFTCSFGTLSPGLKSYLVHQVVKWEKSMPITPWWPTLKTKNKVIFWISLRILHQISVTAKKLITCFKISFFCAKDSFFYFSIITNHILCIQHILVLHRSLSVQKRTSLSAPTPAAVGICRRCGRF